MTTCPEDGEVLARSHDYMHQALDPELRPGETIGEYVIEGLIGRGTFGYVYRAIQPLIAKQVAIKVLSRKYSVDLNVVSRFIAEARAVNHIRHKNIIDIFSFGQLPDGRHYHIMELLEGIPLDQYLKSRGRLPIEEALFILRPLGKALDSAHAAGIVHRDLKPANVFLSIDEEGRPFPKLLDFGIAKLMSEDLPRHHQTATGIAVGTPDYMSPEQCQGRDVDHRTDIYAFGVMTYQLLTGELPFVGTTGLDVLMKQMTSAAAAPSAICRDLPAAIDAAILAMMEKDKAMRPATLAKAVRALDEVARALGIPVPGPGSSDGFGAAVSGSFPPGSPAASGPRSSGEMARVRTPPLSREISRPSGWTSPLDDPLLASYPQVAERTSRLPAPRVIILGVSLLVLGGFAAGMFLTRSSDDRERDLPRAPSGVPIAFPSASPGAPANAPAIVPAPSPSAAAAAETKEPKTGAEPLTTIALDVRSAVPQLEIIGPDGALLGRGEGTIHLPRGDQPIRLSFQAPGFFPASRDVLPKGDGAIDVVLRKKPVKMAKPPAKPSKKPNKDDLEAPF